MYPGVVLLRIPSNLGTIRRRSSSYSNSKPEVCLGPEAEVQIKKSRSSSELLAVECFSGTWSRGVKVED